MEAISSTKLAEDLGMFIGMLVLGCNNQTLCMVVGCNGPPQVVSTCDHDLLTLGCLKL
jgi:hypothetical protein